MKKFCVLLLFAFTLIAFGCTKSEPPQQLPQIDKSKYQRVDKMRELEGGYFPGEVFENADGYYVIEALIEQSEGYQKKDDLKRPIEGVYWYVAKKGSFETYFDYPSKYKIKPGIYDIYFHGRDGIYYQADLFEERK